jgi:hypothetical protein
MDVSPFRFAARSPLASQLFKIQIIYINYVTPWIVSFRQWKAPAARRWAGREDGKAIRAASIYAYLDRAFAEFAWSRKKGMHLYEVEIAEEDIVHIGDLNSFTTVVDANKQNKPTGEAVSKYWEGVLGGRQAEVLVRKARVVRKIKDNSEHYATRGG